MYSVWTHFKKCLQRQENFDRKIWLFHNENETYLIAGRKSTESQQGNWIILMHRLFVAGKILRKGFTFSCFICILMIIFKGF